MTLKFYTISVYIIAEINDIRYTIYYEEIREFYNDTSKQKYIFSPFYAFLKFVSNKNLYAELKFGRYLVKIVDENNKYEIFIENGNFEFCGMKQNTSQKYYGLI